VKWLLTMGQLGLPIEKHHHEVGRPPASKGNGFFASPELDHAADNVQKPTKRCGAHVGQENMGPHRHLLPKPRVGDNGSGSTLPPKPLGEGRANRCSSGKGPTPTSSQDQPAWYIGGLPEACPSFGPFTTPANQTAQAPGCRGFEAR